MKKSSWLTLPLMLLIGAVVLIDIPPMLLGRYRKFQAKRSFEALDLLCSRGSPIPVGNPIDSLFRPLLSSRGEPFLLQLQAKYPSVAWHERSFSVFYLTATTAAGGSLEHSINWLSSMDGETYNSTCLNFEPSLLLKRVRVDVDEIVVDFEFSKSLKDPVEFHGKTFVPGGSYETRIAIKDFSAGSKSATELIAELYSNSKKK